MKFSDSIPNCELLSEPDSPANGGLGVFLLNIHSDSRWDRFVDSHPDGLIYHHSSWLRALETEYGRECVSLACQDANGTLLGIFPLFYTRGLPLNVDCYQIGRRLSSLPRTPVGGPLFTKPEAATVLLQAAKRLAKDQQTLLEIKTQSRSLVGITEGLSCVLWRQAYVLSLQEGLRKANHQSRTRIKWAVNKASKMGVRVRVADDEKDLQSWYQIYLQTMRRNVVPARSYRFFASLWELLQPRGLMNLLLAELHQRGKRRLLAGSIFFSFKDTLFFPFNGSRKQDFRFHANDIIVWHAIQDALNKGHMWVDFGEVAEEHQQLARFKMKWGSEPRQLYRYYYAALGAWKEPKMRRAKLDFLLKATWRRMPLKATAELGDWIYSFL